MKFNKSAKSEYYYGDYFWYVGDDHGIALGKIKKISEDSGYNFETLFYSAISTKQMREITSFMESIEKQYGIDTTSTFTSNEDR